MGLGVGTRDQPGLWGAGPASHLDSCVSPSLGAAAPCLGAGLSGGSGLSWGQFRNPKVSLRVRLCDLLGHLQRSGERDCQEFYRALYIHAQPLHSCLPSRHALRPMAFLTCLGLAAGLALLLYCCPPDPKVLPGARRVLGFSPVIVDRHVSRFLLAFLTDDLGGL
ncbi:caspase recruitment domain-containing protein 19 isoform X4 [Camelus dromedarius]|uniref:caspase recruitment domain-containing protein 19 isoform X4 n=1 Tax=Camelus dromedarius TaxID=9838 RepID=UPI003119BFC1